MPGEEIPVTHGSYFWYAHEEGLLASDNANIVSPLSCPPLRILIPSSYYEKHVGIRNALHSWDDEKDDYEAGFVISYADDIEEGGWQGIVKKIRDTVGDNPVYSMCTQSYHNNSQVIKSSWGCLCLCVDESREA